MPDWECKELIYELKSPVHIGKGQTLGIIDRTRYYIPGKTMWGAVVAKIGQQFESENDHKWDSLKKFVHRNMVFTYFFVAKQKGETVYTPCYSKCGLKYGELTERQFETKFISSFASAGVEKVSGTASEGDLHELEFVKDKKKSGESVYLKGFLLLNNQAENNHFSLKFDEGNIRIVYCDRGKEKKVCDLIDDLRIGGERNYGFGRVELVDPQSLNREQKHEKIFGVPITPGEKGIDIKEQQQSDEVGPLFGHLIVKQNNGDSHFGKLKTINGELEPLVEREWNGSPGNTTKFGGVGLKPGSQVKFKDGSKPKLRIEDYGRLNFITEASA